MFNRVSLHAHHIMAKTELDYMSWKEQTWTIDSAYLAAKIQTISTGRHLVGRSSVAA